MIGRTQQVEDLLELTEAAMTIALALALGNLRLLELPNGGSVSFTAIPILVFAVRHGMRRGAYVALVTGIGHALLGGTIIHPAQLLLDYGVAFAVLGVGGAARSAGAGGIRVAIVCAHLLQWACFTVSGVAFFSSGPATPAIWMYSAAYNATTCLPETMLSLMCVPWLVRIMWESLTPTTRRALRGRVAPVQLRPRTVAKRSPSTPAVLPVPAARAPLNGRAAPLAARPRNHRSPTRAISSGTSPFALQMTPLRRDFGR